MLPVGETFLPFSSLWILEVFDCSLFNRVILVQPLQYFDDLGEIMTYLYEDQLLTHCI